jgi:hypothetical protein
VLGKGGGADEITEEDRYLLALALDGGFGLKELCG